MEQMEFVDALVAPRMEMLLTISRDVMATLGNRYCGPHVSL